MKDILILGVGNLVLKDEGIGIHAYKPIRKKKNYRWGSICWTEAQAVSS